MLTENGVPNVKVENGVSPKSSLSPLQQVVQAVAKQKTMQNENMDQVMFGNVLLVNVDNLYYTKHDLTVKLSGIPNDRTAVSET